MSAAAKGSVRIVGGGPLHGRVRVPGDKSLSHRALLVAALAEGTSELRGLSDGDDVTRTAAALRAFGLEVREEAGGGVRSTIVEGGRDRFKEPERPLDLGNSGTGLRLLAGVAATLPFLTVLTGDESIHRRPMGRIVEPLRAMGARVDGRRDATLAPIVVRGGALTGLRWRPVVPSAQVKGAVLLAGLGAEGATTLEEVVATRRHTEELLAVAGAPATVEPLEGGGVAVSVARASLSPFEFDVPGDPSQAAFLVVAATIVPGSDIVVEDVYVGPGRAGFLDVLARMGADVTLESRRGEVADLRIRHAPLRATTVGGAEVSDLIDEVPALALAAAFATGSTEFRDAAELRAKESDRIATTVSELRALGVAAHALEDGLVVDGGGGEPPPGLLAGATARSHGDHRIAMTLAVGGLAAGRAPGAGVEIADFDAVATSWPGLLSTLAALRPGEPTERDVAR